MKLLSAFARYWFRPTLANWRNLRRVCMARLPETRYVLRQAELKEPT